jgi:hypothetical protein
MDHRQPKRPVRLSDSAREQRLRVALGMTVLGPTEIIGTLIMTVASTVSITVGTFSAGPIVS